MTAVCAAPTLPSALPSVGDLEEAEAIVRRHMAPTPQYAWPLLAERLGLETWVKHENHTPIGAFKVRGGLVYLTRLRQTQPCVGGVISATRGNHGQSLALAARAVGLRCVIVVPQGNNPEKNAAMRALGAELVVHGADFQAAAEHALLLSTTQGLHFVPSIHPWLVQGVATYGLELFRAVPDLDVIHVPIGMGSGICGLLAAKQATGVKTKIIGVVAEGAPAYHLSFLDGRVIATPSADTEADGVACRSPDAWALERILDGAANVVTVSDGEIRAAIRALLADTHNLAEPAGAVGLAALIKHRDQWRGGKAAVVLSGGNIDRAHLKRILDEDVIP